MCTQRTQWPLRVGGMAIIAGFVASFTFGTARAQRVAADPVEDLRQALKVAVRDPMKNPDELDFRQKNVAKKIDALTSVNELRRALQLQASWRDDDRDERVASIDQPLRARVADRFRKSLHEMMQNGRLSQLAAANLLEDVGTSIRGTGTEDKGGVTRALAPDLITLLKVNDVAVQEAAARALGKINADPTKAGPALGDLLKTSTDARLHRAAAAGLANLIQVVTQINKGRTTVTGVVAEPEDVIKAALAAVPAVGPGLTVEDSETRRSAAEALQNAALAMSELIGDPKPRQELPPEGRKLSEEEIKDIVDYREAVEAERKSVTPIAVALKQQIAGLRHVLQDPDPKVRLTASKALEEIGNAYQRQVQRINSVPRRTGDKPDAGKGKEAFLPLLNHGHSIDRLNSHVGERLLVSMQKEKTLSVDSPLFDLIIGLLPDLDARLDDPDVRVRLTTMNVLEMLGADAYRAAPQLMKALNDPSRFVRWSAVRTLGKTKPLPEAIPALTRLLEARDLGVRMATMTTLENYGNAAKDTVRALAEATRRGDVESRESAIRTLESLGTSIAQPAIPLLVDALGDRDARVRRVAAEALGKFGPVAVQAESGLRKNLDDEDSESRRAASEALLNIRKK